MDIQECTRPVLFETGYDEVPYGCKGSGFVVAFGEQYYFITLDHVVKKLDPKTILVPYSPGSEYFLPFNMCFRCEEYDLYCMRIDKASLDNSIHVPHVDITTLESSSLCTRRERDFISFGYPAENGKIDYDKESIWNTLTAIRFAYSDSSYDHHTTVLQVGDKPRLISYDGFSGSPVFYVRNGRVSSLAGILAMGEAKNKVVHFINASVVYDFLRSLS